MTASATGRIDGLVFALGMLTGVYAYAEFTPGIETWYAATAQGEMTLPALTEISTGAWVLAFAAFLGFELRRAKLHGTDAAVQRFKARVREMTNRSNGRTMTARIEALKRYVSGGLNDFGHSHSDAEVVEWDQWLRRRVRLCYWKQWQRPRTRRRSSAISSACSPLARSASTRASSMASRWRITCLSQSVAPKALRSLT